MTDNPIVGTSDPEVAYTPDAIWTVTNKGGPRCLLMENPNTYWIDTHGMKNTPPKVGCCLPLAHTGDCLPVAAELLDRGIRLHPVARL